MVEIAIFMWHESKGMLVLAAIRIVVAVVVVGYMIMTLIVACL